MKSELPPEFRAAEAAAWLRPTHRAPLKALEALHRSGRLIRLKRGLYSFSDRVHPLAAAGSIHGPSYVSFETALAHYGLIPERVPSILSVVDGRSASFSTPLGVYEYYSQSRELFAFGMGLQRLPERAFLIAIPEKAVLDTLVRARLRSANQRPEQVLEFVTESLRMDVEQLRGLSVIKMRNMAPLYRNLAPTRLIEAIEKSRAGTTTKPKSSRP